MTQEIDSDDNEPPEESESNEKRTIFYILRLKLAVAVAIIRQTPAGSSPEKYAASLVRNFTEDIDTWKTKCETLENNVLALEQQLQTMTLKGKINVPGLDINLNENASLERSVVPFVPPTQTLIGKISNTLDFVRSFILLGSVSHENLEHTGSERSRESLKDTVLRSVATLFEHLRCEDGLLLDFEITKCAINAMHRLLDSRANFFEQDLMSLMMEFLENLLRDIFRTLDINKMTYQHRRSAIIQMLAEHRRITPLVLSRLLREITVLSDSLATHFQPDVEDFTSLLHMENAYYVFQATEGTLHIMRQQNSALNAFKIPKALVHEWDKTTEKSLLEIGTHLPMYSLYVWHVKALLKSVLETDMED